VLVEEADVEESVSRETNEKWWDEWAAHGPQGPIEDDGEPGFP
jgi:hypothetical protein